MADHRTFELPGAGLKCANCNAPLRGVAETIQSPGFITRFRDCEKCGKRNQSSERVIAARNKRRYFHEPGE